jgi:hypothetical protein
MNYDYDKDKQPDKRKKARPKLYQHCHIGASFFVFGLAVRERLHPRFISLFLTDSPGDLPAQLPSRHPRCSQSAEPPRNHEKQTQFR